MAPLFFPIMGCGASSADVRSHRKSHESHSIGRKQFLDLQKSTKARADRDVSPTLYTSPTGLQCNDGDVQLREVTSVRDYTQGDTPPSQGLSNMQSLKLGLKMLQDFSFSFSKKAHRICFNKACFCCQLDCSFRPLTATAGIPLSTSKDT